jgi:hypothetical protein
MDSSFSYAIDAEDRLISVGSTWDRFAQDNGAENLSGGNIVGRQVWTFFANPGVREIYQSIFRRVRESQQPLEVPFRCDSPTERRYMTICVQPGPDLGLVIQGRQLRAEPRPPVPFLDPNRPRTKDFLVVCSWCKKVKDDPDWLEIEFAVDNNPQLQGESLPRMTHGICKPCKTEALAGLH